MTKGRRIFELGWKGLGRLCGAALLIGSFDAAAAELSEVSLVAEMVTAVPQQGTMAHLPNAEWAATLTDPEMEEMRGGFFGLGFSFFGTLNTTDAVTGGLTFNSDQLVAPPEIGPNGAVNFGASLGTNNFNGFNGVLQHLSVVGDGNVVGQTLYMNIIVLRDANRNSVSALMSALGPGS